ncbi:hypothetical protein Q2100_28685 [Mycolicibacterium sp. KC 300]|uniref:Uncharacterized protein n=1 Tax=Mycolicibacterium arseniciresistens TaxID=3062257 RepID=A0ABT8UPN2_9MYCO|nr:hypothetical protein [Mycolicibacterium arseniciresistens]MDO3639752.1 hypothetical protein [Mycolicibacterium arseniciresistens]
MATAAIEIFNRAVGQEDHQWALLFDEMELAPTTIVEALLEAMRGLPENLLLKLSISPVQPELARLNLPYAGVHGQDFDLIQLTYARQNHAVELGKRMLEAEARRLGIKGSPAAELLGRSVFASFDDGEGGRDRAEHAPRDNPYAANGDLWKRYKSLANVDESFRLWLRGKDVDLNELERLSPVARAAKLRKVRNLVVVRENYRRSNAARRSRKSYALYTGADTVLTICDGNPRLLTALLGQLLSGATGGDNKISRSAQSAAVDSVIRRFFALISSAEAVPLRSGRVASLYDLVHRIGEAFAERVVEEEFSDNVPLRFTVDRGVNSATIELLRLGINMGVFVHIPKRSDARVPLALFGEHFRLSYVLAPYFGLPVRLGPTVRLSTLLAPRSKTVKRGIQKVRQAESPEDQYVLFLEPRIERR